MKLQVINGEPIIEQKENNTFGVAMMFGLHRDRHPENNGEGWRWTTMMRAVEVDTENLPPAERENLVIMVVEDLLAWYGTGRPKEFREKLEEFGIEFNFK